MRVNKPNFSFEEILEKAEILLLEHGKFLLVYDVIKSRLFEDQIELLNNMKALHDYVNSYCKKYVVCGNIRRLEITGMIFANGDSGFVYLNNCLCIAHIMLMAEYILPLKCRWMVCAEDNLEPMHQFVR